MLMPLSLGGSAVAPSPRRNPRWIRIWREEGRGGGSGGPENKEGRGDDGWPGGVLERDRERAKEVRGREGASVGGVTGGSGRLGFAPVRWVALC
jgi:hypothetical protein